MVGISLYEKDNKGGFNENKRYETRYFVTGFNKFIRGYNGEFEDRMSEYLFMSPTTFLKNI